MTVQSGTQGAGLPHKGAQSSVSLSTCSALHGPVPPFIAGGDGSVPARTIVSLAPSQSGNVS